MLTTDTDTVRFLPPSWWPPLLLKCLFLSYKPESGEKELPAVSDWTHAAAAAAARLLRGKMEEEKVKMELGGGGGVEERQEGDNATAAVQFFGSLLSSRWTTIPHIISTWSGGREKNCS